MPQPDNVLLIVVDQLRADALSCYGNHQLATPHIDSLAANGVRFDTCHTPLPICTPARYSFLTGVYPHEHRGLTNHSTPLPRYQTFVETLRSRGYRTCAVGKMHYTPTYLDVGYDRMILAEQDGPGRFEDDYHRELMEAGLLDLVDLYDQRHEYREHAPDDYWQTFGAQPSTLPEGWDSTGWIARKAMAELDNWRDDAANMLTVSFIKPHHPFDPPQPWFDDFAAREFEPMPGWCEATSEEDLAIHGGYFPHTKLNDAAIRRVTAAYFAAIAQIDHHVGQMLARLSETGQAERTWVVFISDHGDYLGAHHLLLKNNFMYEQLLRVPFVVQPPAGREAARGAVDGRLTSLLDLPRTVCGAVGVEPPKTAGGLDLTDAEASRDWLISESGPGEFSVRSKTHKYVEMPTPNGARFYDLEADPGETQNLIADGAPAVRERVAAHREALHDWLCGTCMGEAFGEERPRAVCDHKGQIEAVRSHIDRAARAALGMSPR